MVYGEWPGQDADLQKAVSIVFVGIIDEVVIQPYVAGQKTLANGTIEYIWAISSVEIPLQMDVWSASIPDRSDLSFRMRQALYRGRDYTKVSPVGSLQNADPYVNDLLLPGAFGLDGCNICYDFDPPVITDSPDAAQRNEYRATFKGSAQFTLIERAVSPALAGIKFKMRISNFGSPPTMSGTYDIAATAAKVYSKDVP